MHVMTRRRTTSARRNLALPCWSARRLLPCLALTVLSAQRGRRPRGGEAWPPPLLPPRYSPPRPATAVAQAAAIAGPTEGNGRRGGGGGGEASQEGVGEEVGSRPGVWLGEE
uniref:Uncharacterized protein n=1 Tax=Oryza nivara TaxID=4536 RepID=A0A0E0IPH3_ORYNI